MLLVFISAAIPRLRLSLKKCPSWLMLGTVTWKRRMITNHPRRLPICASHVLLINHLAQRAFDQERPRPFDWIMDLAYVISDV
jgi:hypothetical protein